MAIGRPKKYKSKKALSAEIERYFRSISHTEAVKNALGQVVFNDDGELMTYTHYDRPPSVLGLCLFLGIDRRTWENYCDEKLHPEFKNITSHTRARLEAYLEEQLLTREKGIQGIIFNLQNNYGWKDKKEVELGEETRQALPAVSLQEKLAIINAAKAALEGDDPE